MLYEAEIKIYFIEAHMWGIIDTTSNACKQTINTFILLCTCSNKISYPVFASLFIFAKMYHVMALLLVNVYISRRQCFKLDVSGMS